jgi:hypothetical protein
MAAPMRTIITTAREEAAVISHELANTAKASASTAGGAGRTVAMEAMNPLGVRQAAEMTVKEGMGGRSIYTPC